MALNNVHAIGGIGLVGAISLTYIVYSVKTKTNGNPPLWIMYLVVIIISHRFIRNDDLD